MSETMLTTIDNPFNPFEDFVNWMLYDTAKGYNTSSRIDRLMPNDSSLSSIEEDRILESVMDNIVKYDPLQLYIKVDEKSAAIVAAKAGELSTTDE